MHGPGHRSALSTRLSLGMHQGLPTPVYRTPFGNENRIRDELGIAPGALSVLVALLAAEFVQIGPVSGDDLDDIVEGQPRAHFVALEKGGWIEAVGHLPKKTTKIYRPTAKAWRELLPDGWSLLREVAA